MSEENKKSKPPELASELRRHPIVVPPAIYEASGITVMGTRIKSILFSTDIAIIANNNAHAILCVYPFTPQINITSAVISVARTPVFVGVGGGKTSGHRSLNMALQAELMGAYGVVVNAPMSNKMIKHLHSVVDIPVIATVCGPKDDFLGKVMAGARILNVSAAGGTVDLIHRIRQELGSHFPIIATGGPTEESILATIEAGANAITYTPPTSGEIFHDIMARYREERS